MQTSKHLRYPIKRRLYTQNWINFQKKLFFKNILCSTAVHCCKLFSKIWGYLGQNLPWTKIIVKWQQLWNKKSYQTIHSYGQPNPEGPRNLLYDILKEVEGGMHIEVLAAGELIWCRISWLHKAFLAASPPQLTPVGAGQPGFNSGT